MLTNSITMMIGFLFVMIFIASQTEALQIPSKISNFFFLQSSSIIKPNSIFYNQVFKEQSVSNGPLTLHENKINNFKRSVAIIPTSIAIFLVGCVVDSSIVFASGEEAVQLLYGYHTNIPSAITWTVLLYGAYKTYFTVFRWLASW